MWNRLHLEQFKCFAKTEIELKPLTLFHGINSSGKSSAIQALALMSQTISDNEWNQEIQLNGSNVSMGTCEDIINRSTGRSEFSLGLADSHCQALWTAISGDRKDDLVAKIGSIKLTNCGKLQQWSIGTKETDHLTQKPLYRLLPADWHQTTPVIQQFAEHLCRIKYLSAERIGPRETFPLSPKANFDSVGARGEFTAHYLDRFGPDDANQGLALEDKSQTIRKATVGWMNRLFPGFNFDVQRVHGTSLATLKMQTSDVVQMFRPQNVGFGLSHVLPIVTLCVGSKKGDCLIIESPEVHLHPAGQSQLGLMLGVTAASGVQVIVETHSDHILNGIRKAVKRKVLSHEEAVFNFFHLQKSADSVTHFVEALKCDENGRISTWPPMFFDQMQSDLLELA